MLFLIIFSPTKKSGTKSKPKNSANFNYLFNNLTE